jgi:hypothetical protein
MWPGELRRELKMATKASGLPPYSLNPWFLVLGSWFLVPGPWFLLSDPHFLVPVRLSLLLFCRSGPIRSRSWLDNFHSIMTA